MHYRKTIRDKIKTLLTGAVLFESSALNVFQTRAVPYWEEELPCITFYTHNDKTDHQDTAPRIYKHDYRVVIEIIIEEKTNQVADDVLDEIADQIEDLFEQDPSMDDTVDDCSFEETTTVQKPEGDRLFVAAIMILNIDYKTRAPKVIPVGALENFESSDIGIAVDGTSVEAIGANITLP